MHLGSGEHMGAQCLVERREDHRAGANLVSRHDNLHAGRLSHRHAGWALREGNRRHKLRPGVPASPGRDPKLPTPRRQQ